MFATKKSGDRSQLNHFWERTANCGKEFCLETSIHGFSHIAAPKRHWIERFLWLGVLCAAVWGMTETFLGQLQRYRENSTVVTLEKDFRSWSFSLPAVTARIEDRVDPTKEVRAIRSRWNVSPEDQSYAYYQRFVATVVNSDLFHLQGYEEFIADSTLDVDLKELVTVENQIKITSSLNVNMNWSPVMTEAGVCFVTNSLAIADIALLPSTNGSDILPHSCQYFAMTCWIMFETFNNANFYVHSPYDVADITTAASRTYPTIKRYTDLKVTETRAGAGVRALRPRRRRCLYTDEPTDNTRNVYSTNTCLLACRSRLARQLCQCVPFYYFYDGGPACGPSGMHCLAQHANRLAAARCICGQQCLEALFHEVASDVQIWEKGIFQSRGSVRFAVQAPRTRYTREIVFHLQDLVVSFGGAAGLFLGASFISFVELLYFLVHRCCRLFMAREQNKPVTIKNSRVTFETTRIQEITLILKEASVR